MKRDELVWHYTSGDHLQEILRSGVLRPSTNDAMSSGERPAVWFTERQEWDPATSLGLQASPEKALRGALAWLKDGPTAAVKENTDRLSPANVGGLARIGVDPSTAPHTWADFKRASGIPEADARIRERLDRERGSDPAEWRVSFVPVPASAWVSVQRRVRGEWQDVAHPGATRALLSAMRR